jgi:hypothetical protein
MGITLALDMSWYITDIRKIAIRSRRLYLIWNMSGTQMSAWINAHLIANFFAPGAVRAI